MTKTEVQKNRSLTELKALVPEDDGSVNAEAFEAFREWLVASGMPLDDDDDEEVRS